MQRVSEPCQVCSHSLIRRTNSTPNADEVAELRKNMDEAAKVRALCLTLSLIGRVLTACLPSLLIAGARARSRPGKGGDRGKRTGERGSLIGVSFSLFPSQHSKITPFRMCAIPVPGTTSREDGIPLGRLKRTAKCMNDIVTRRRRLRFETSSVRESRCNSSRKRDRK